MQIVRDISRFLLDNTVVTTGNFDGVHLGHQFLLKSLVEEARQQNAPSVVVMFYPHPREVLSAHDTSFRYISDDVQKFKIFEDCGVDYVVQVPFDLEMAAWSAEDFIKRILLDKLGMCFFLVGYDHKLGNPKYDNNIAKLSQKYGFVMKQCAVFKQDDVCVSSTCVRTALAQGQLSDVQRILGRYYALRCMVVEGKKIGRSIGFPTANLEVIFPLMLLPKEGVYVVQVSWRERIFGGMMQIGHRPTLQDGRGLTLEVHLFDFDHNLYGHEVEISFIHFLRANMKFDSMDDLRLQLHRDEEDSRSLLGLL